MILFKKKKVHENNVILISLFSILGTLFLFPTPVQLPKFYHSVNAGAYTLHVENGKTYLLRVINAAMND